MQRSLYSAVSGMRNHQTKMDVIGNNIANVNTTAFKAGGVLFQDILSQTIRGASGPQGGQGGINPMQVGLGMNIATITNNHTQGSLQVTGRSTDLAVQGSGFFMVSDGQSQYYTRDGAFSLGPDGFLVNSASGYRLQGWTYDTSGEVNTTVAPSSLYIPIGGSRIASPSENLYFSGNLNAEQEIGSDVTITTVLFDSLGIEHEVEITYTKDALNTWSWEARYGDIVIDGGDISFTDGGNFAGVTSDVITISAAQLGTGAGDLSVDLNFSAVTQVSGPMDILARFQDGYPSGVLDAFTISKTGVISGIYSNGMVRSLGVVALAGFTNPGGLSKIAGNLYQPSANSGQALISTPGQQGLGTVEAATLEMSNVDLVNEFTEMITTSRAFQANSRVITTSDDMLAEVVNIKR